MVPLLVVVGGRSGTGKTTLARLVVGELGAAYVHLDSIVSPILRGDWGIDERSGADIGYDVARAIATENLRCGLPVVVDGLNHTAERRSAWREVAANSSAHLVQLETTIEDVQEHRRRVETRHVARSGLVGPSWNVIQMMAYEQWDEVRDGMRLRVEMSDPAAALTSVLDHLRLGS